jgi:hypothetical protein
MTRWSRCRPGWRRAHVTSAHAPGALCMPISAAIPFYMRRSAALAFQVHVLRSCLVEIKPNTLKSRSAKRHTSRSPTKSAGPRRKTPSAELGQPSTRNQEEVICLAAGVEYPTRLLRVRRAAASAVSAPRPDPLQSAAPLQKRPPPRANAKPRLPRARARSPRAKNAQPARRNLRGASGRPPRRRPVGAQNVLRQPRRNLLAANARQRAQPGAARPALHVVLRPLVRRQLAARAKRRARAAEHAGQL